MFTVKVLSISPAGVRTTVECDYYEVFDALTVAEIELRNALIPTGWAEVTEPDRLSYEAYSFRTGESVKITVVNAEGIPVTLRDKEN